MRRGSARSHSGGEDRNSLGMSSRKPLQAAIRDPRTTDGTCDLWIPALAALGRDDGRHYPASRKSPAPFAGGGIGRPSPAYSLSLLRRVRIEMPSMLAAWVRLPRQCF